MNTMEARKKHTKNSVRICAQYLLYKFLAVKNAFCATLFHNCANKK